MEIESKNSAAGEPPITFERVKELIREEIRYNLETARRLYPDFDSRCEKYGFNDIAEIWNRLLGGYTIDEIHSGFRDCFSHCIGFISPANIVNYIETWKDEREKMPILIWKQEENERGND